MGDLVIVSKLADLENVPYYGDLKLSSGTINPIEEKNNCILTGYDITIQAHDYPAIRCYNSAVYKNTDGQEFYIFCPLSEPNYLMIWKTGSIFSYSRYNNVQYENVYLDTLNYGAITADGATFPYFNYSLDYRNVGGENNVKWIDSLPIFDNLQDFVDYVTAPLEPRGEATCKVTYFLPDDDYQYTKLTYKKDVQPESVNDGTIVNLDPTQDSVNVEGLIENASYWFKIFTNKSESEAFGYTVGEIPGPIIPPDLQPYVDLLASYGVGTNQTSSLTNCQDYSGNSNTVSMEGYSVCINGNFNVNGNQYYMYIMTNCDIMVTNNNDSISVEYSFTMAPYNTIKTWGRSMWGAYEHSGNRIEYLALGTWTPAVPLDFYQPYNVDNVDITFTTSFNSMVNCMNYLTQHFRRCNLYVDGKQWLKVN